jgi:hypothetical protein
MYRGTLSQHREGSPQAQVQAALLIPCGKIRFGIKIEVKGINNFFRDPTSGVTEALADLLRHHYCGVESASRGIFGNALLYG